MALESGLEVTQGNHNVFKKPEIPWVLKCVHGKHTEHFPNRTVAPAENLIRRSLEGDRDWSTWTGEDARPSIGVARCPNSSHPAHYPR